VQHKIQICTHECVANSVRKKMPRRYGAGIITFQKLETLTNTLVYGAAWFIAGRGQPTNWAESCSTIYRPMHEQLRFWLEVMLAAIKQ
jgi:hypothetical protein